MHMRRWIVRISRLSVLAMAVLIAILPVRSRAQVMLQAFYWDVPSPYVSYPSAPWWWDRLATNARDIRDAGFTALWIPPCTKGASGDYSVGYDPFDDYDLGSRLQRGRSIATRYGTREQLERCIAILRSNHLNCYLDLVENHRNGDPAAEPFHFVYRNAYGAKAGGRFEKTRGDFHPNVPEDPAVPDDSAQFGRDLAHVNSVGHHVFGALIDAIDWQTRALDTQGYRMDFVKGISTEWLVPMLTTKSMRTKFVVGEFWDTDRNKVEQWVSDSSIEKGMEGRASAFDFPLQSILRRMCDGGNFDMRELDHAGLDGIDPAHAVTFVENHDTDRSDENKIVTNKMLAYAYILTSEGYPCVYYRDYSLDSGCYRLKPRIDPLIKIHEKLASGTAQERWKDQDLFVFERMGGKHLLVGLNRAREARTVTVATGFAPGTTLTDYTGMESSVAVNPQGNVVITMPANTDGSGYVCYAPTGLDLSITDHAPNGAVSQDYEAASDLDIMPARTDRTTDVCRIYAEGGTDIRIALAVGADLPNTTHFELEFSITGPDKHKNEFRFDPPNGSSALRPAPRSIRATSTGYYQIQVRAQKTSPGVTEVPFNLRVSYTAPRTLSQ